MYFSKDFLDRNDFVLPGPSPTGKPADNGILFTTIAYLIGFDFPAWSNKWDLMIYACYLKKGLIARWPGNNFDQSAWDDYLAIAVGCIHFKNKTIAREILLYGITHFGFYNTDGKLKFSDFLWRNIPIWPLMICAAFPILKYLMFIPLFVVKLFFKKPSLEDTSGTQLQWLYILGCNKLGFNFKNVDNETMKAVFSVYYHKDHPFNNMEEVK